MYVPLSLSMNAFGFINSNLTAGISPRLLIVGEIKLVQFPMRGIVGYPWLAAILSRTQTIRLAGSFSSISIDNSSRLKSLTTMNVCKQIQQMNVSYIK